MRPPKNKLMTSRKRERNQAGTWKCGHFGPPCRFFGKVKGDIPQKCSLWFLTNLSPMFSLKNGWGTRVTEQFGIHFFTDHFSCLQIRVHRAQKLWGTFHNIEFVGFLCRVIFGLHWTGCLGFRPWIKFLFKRSLFQVMPNIFCFCQKNAQNHKFVMDLKRKCLLQSIILSALSPSRKPTWQAGFFLISNGKCIFK